MINSIIKVSTLLFGVAILLSGHGLQLAIVPLRAEQAGWTSIENGFLGSAYFVGFLIGCFLIPKLVSRSGHIRVFATLTSIMTTVILGLVIFEDYYFWILLRLMAGITISGLYLVIESWLNDQTDNEVRGGVLAIYTVVVLLSLALGQLLLNIAPIADDRIIVLSAILISLAAIPICITRSSQPIEIPTASFSPLLVLKTSRAAALGVFVAGLVTSAFYTLGPVYGIETGMDVRQISSMMALGILGGAMSQFPLGRYSDGKDRRVILLAVMTAGAVVAFISWLLKFDNAAMNMLFLGIFMMPIYALSLALASDNVENSSFLEVGTGLLVVNAVGSIIGPLVAAQGMQNFGAQSFFLFIAVVLVLGAGSTLFFIRSRAPDLEDFNEFNLATTASAQGAIQMDPRTEDEVS
jgi:MFS family permease